MIPNKKNVQPRYDQKTFSEEEKTNKLLNIVAPIGSGGKVVEIHQNAWFSLGRLEKGKEVNYRLNDNENGVYVFVLDGEVTVNDTKLERRDGFGITESEEISIVAGTDADILLMEVPV